MIRVKQLGKKILGIDSFSNLTPINNLIHLGTKFHGYLVPDGIINNDSVCYCVGAGDDISFDTELVTKFNANVFTFDPSPEGKEHYQKLVDHTQRGDKLQINIDDLSFTYSINSDQLSKLKYIDIGLWDSDTTLKFFNPGVENYVSRSVVLFNNSNDGIDCKVDRLSNQMKKLGHSYLDLLKLEIEGAEYTVIDTIVEDKLDIKMILVEFDEVFHAKGPGYLFRIKRSTDKLLKAGYKLVHTTAQFKRLFLRNDLYERLKSGNQK